MTGTGDGNPPPPPSVPPPTCTASPQSLPAACWGVYWINGGKPVGFPGYYPDSATAVAVAERYVDQTFLGANIVPCRGPAGDWGSPVYNPVTGFSYANQAPPSPVDVWLGVAGTTSACPVSAGANNQYYGAVGLGNIGAHDFPSSYCTPYTIRLELASGAPAQDADTLASLEPGQSIELIAKTYDPNCQSASRLQLQLQVSARQDSGGHHHGDNTVAARTGTLLSDDRFAEISPTQQTLTGITRDDGSGLHFTFTAPQAAGDIAITATCTPASQATCTAEGPKMVWVGHKGLQPLNDNSVYILIPNNNDPEHPDNHNLTLTAASRLAVFATLYHGKYPNLSVLQLNDASLKRGGIFDLVHNWKAPHHEHCGGTAIDIRANGGNGALNITGDGIHTTDDGTIHSADPMIDKLQTIAHVAGIDAVWEVPKDSSGNFVWNRRHFHTRLMGQEGLTCP